MLRPEPYIEEARYYEEQEERQETYKSGCPWCVVCDEQITDPKCYVLDDDNRMESCMCESCMKYQYKKATDAKINTYLIEWISEQLDYGKCWQDTPHR